MTTTYKPYPAYKDSGVEWLGEIPEGWDLWKIIHASSHIGSGTTPKSDNGEYYGGRFLWVTTGELRENTIFDTKKKVNALALSKVPSLKIHPTGSVVIAMYGATIGRLGILGKQATTNQACCVIPPSKTIHNKYLFYWLYAMKQEIINMSSGGGQPNINQEKVAGLKVSAPHCNEQIQIANFLDHETARIDTLIAKQKKLIALLKEKRQAVISHAVTKGLNPDVEMKDSGVEWLGKVPAHWMVCRFKFLCNEIIAGPFGSSITKDMYVKSGFKVYGQEQVIPDDFSKGDYYISEKNYKLLSRYKITTGDILISCVGTFGKIAVVPSGIEEGIINPRLIKVTVNSDCRPAYMRELLKSLIVFKQFEHLSRGGTMGVINIGILNEIILSLPPLVEQNRIFDFLNQQNIKYNLLIEKANYQISLLKERRTALISAAVTGKIDLRDWQGPQEQSAKGLVGQEA